MSAGREKTTRDSEYIQLNPLTDMTVELFKKAIVERRVILQAKDKFRSTAAIMHCYAGFNIYRRSRGLAPTDDFDDPATLTTCAGVSTCILTKLKHKMSVNTKICVDFESNANRLAI